jgi:hypothetical protein
MPLHPHQAGDRRRGRADRPEEATDEDRGNPVAPEEQAGARRPRDID